MTNPLAAYRETKIKTAGPGQLIVMLYAEAVRQLDIAMEYLRKDLKSNPKYIEPFNRAIVKAQDIVTELSASLDFESGGQIAQNLFSLYLYFNRSLMEANFRKDEKAVASVRQMLDELRAAWAEAALKAGSPAREAAGVNIAAG
jgi:flagellar protein FliS